VFFEMYCNRSGALGMAFVVRFASACRIGMFGMPDARRPPDVTMPNTRI